MKQKAHYGFIKSRNEYRTRITGPDGKQISLYAKTEKELDAKVEAAKAMVREEKFRRENPTVKEYSEKWLLIRSASVQQSTMYDYEAIVRRYIIQPLGERYMSEITADDVNLVMVAAAEKSESIYRKVHMIYKAIFRAAFKSHVIDEDPCEDINPKGGKKSAGKEALTDDQVQTLLAAVTGLPVYPFVMVGLYAGLRREEILALQWDSVYLDAPAPYLYVHRVWSISHNRPVIEDRTKSPAGVRKVPIPDRLLQCLVDLKASAKSDFVIANSDGLPLSGTQWQRLWKYVSTRTCEERVYYRYVNGVRTKHTVRPKLGEHARNAPDVIYSIDFHCTPHQLRHTYITNLVRAGVDPKTVQYLAGHENIKVTMDIYAHINYNRPEDLLEKVQNAFK